MMSLGSTILLSLLLSLIGQSVKAVEATKIPIWEKCRYSKKRGTLCYYQKKNFLTNLAISVWSKKRGNCKLNCKGASSYDSDGKFRLCLGKKAESCALAAVKGGVIYGNYCGAGQTTGKCNSKDGRFRYLEKNRPTGKTVRRFVEKLLADGDSETVPPPPSGVCDNVDMVCEKHDKCYGSLNNACSCDKKAVAELRRLTARYRGILSTLGSLERKYKHDRVKLMQVRKISEMYGEKFQAAVVIGLGLTKVYNERSSKFYKNLTQAVQTENDKAKAKLSWIQKIMYSISGKLSKSQRKALSGGISKFKPCRSAGSSAASGGRAQSTPQGGQH